jgi:hypothetical protein
LSNPNPGGFSLSSVPSGFSLNNQSTTPSINWPTTQPSVTPSTSQPNGFSINAGSGTAGLVSQTQPVLEATLTKDPFGKLPNVSLLSSSPRNATTPPITPVGGMQSKVPVSNEKFSTIPQYKISPKSNIKIEPRTPLRSSPDKAVELGRELLSVNQKPIITKRLDDNFIKTGAHIAVRSQESKEDEIPLSIPVSKINKESVSSSTNEKPKTSQNLPSINPIISKEEILPKLTRPGYFMIPSLEELQKLSEEELRNVNDFTVGLVDTGVVRFLGKTDVTGVDLDKIIEFTDRSVDIYPDEYGNKPDIGKSLNKPAEITLYHCWPRSKSTRKRLTDPKSLENYSKKLNKRCREADCTFNSYSTETGTWVFTVDHF